MVQIPTNSSKKFFPVLIFFTDKSVFSLWGGTTTKNAPISVRFPGYWLLTTPQLGSISPQTRAVIYNTRSVNEKHVLIFKGDKIAHTLWRNIPCINKRNLAVAGQKQGSKTACKGVAEKNKLLALFALGIAYFNN